MYKRLMAIFMCAAIMIVSAPTTMFTFANNEESGETQQEKPVHVNAPQNVKTFSGYKAVTLSWKKASGMTYIVTWKGAGKKGSKTIDGNTWTHKVPNVNATYTYTIKAVDAAGNKSAAVEKTGEAVRSMILKVTFKKGATLTSHYGGKVKHKFKKGQTVYATGFRGGRYIFPYKVNGKTRTFFAKKIRMKNAKVHKINTKDPYTRKEAENYVNKSGVSSRTKHLIWVNTYTQREYIFKGKKGKWKCIYGPWLVSTGKPSTPTSTGKFHIGRRVSRVGGLRNWNITKYFSLHGKLSRWKLGYPKSGACVRNTNAHARWIYNNTKKYTRVFVN